MKFVNKIYAMQMKKKEKRETREGTEMPNKKDNGTFGGKENYKYLMILGATLSNKRKCRKNKKIVHQTNEKAFPILV